MGFVGEAINDLLKGVEDITIFFIGYTLLLFVAGEWFGLFYKGTDIFWYPLYALFIVLFIKIMLDLSRGGKKKK